MNNIIVATDFSASSVNAANYASEFAIAYNCNLLLAYIYSIPVSYAADGVTLATINDSIDEARIRLSEETERIKTAYPQLHIEARLVTGDLLETLQLLTNEQNAGLIILGAAGEYSELWLWDDDWLSALVTVQCPVLVIPKHSSFAPVKNIAFACDYIKVCEQSQSDTIRRWVTLTGANLYIVHVTAAPDLHKPNNAAIAIQEAFKDINPQYHTVQNKLIIKGVAGFIKQQNIDLLLVIPRKHGLWHSLFNKSYTKQLALLNDIPVMSVHDK